FYSGGAELLVHLVGDGLYLPRIGASTNGELTREPAGLLIEPQNADVGGLLALASAYRYGDLRLQFISLHRFGSVCFDSLRFIVCISSAVRFNTVIGSLWQGTSGGEIKRGTTRTIKDRTTNARGKPKASTAINPAKGPRTRINSFARWTTHGKPKPSTMLITTSIRE